MGFLAFRKETRMLWKSIVNVVQILFLYPLYTGKSGGSTTLAAVTEYFPDCCLVQQQKIPRYLPEDFY
jgi:hypothetical protein